MHLSIIVHACNPGNWKLRQEDHHEVKANLGYIVSSKSKRGPERVAVGMGWDVCVCKSKPQ